MKRRSSLKNQQEMKTKPECCSKNDKVIIPVGEYVERKGLIDMLSAHLV